MELIKSHRKDVMFFIKDKKGVYVNCNQYFLDCLELTGADEVIGKTDHDLIWKDYAPLLRSHDNFVLNHDTAQSFQEKSFFRGEHQHGRSFKSPAYGHTGKIIGIMGASITQAHKSTIPITPQQTACLRLLAHGMTHKQIARELGLSDKTVEHYINAIKLRLDCESRAELVMQAIERGLISIF